MKLRGDVIAFLIVIGVALLCFAYAGCATPQLRGNSIRVDGPTYLLSGPAAGHLIEESEGRVGLYTVRGTDCKGDAAVTDEAADSLRIVSNYHFTVDAGKSLCAIPMKDDTRVSFHAERQ